MSQIGVSYTPSSGSPVYNFIIDNFDSNDLPRSYQGDAGFSKSANGTSIISGPAYRQKHSWVFSTMMTTAKAAEFDEMFQAWEDDRAAGLNVAIGIVDETWGASVSKSAVFSSAPTYTYLNGKDTLVSFGLTEV